MVDGRVGNRALQGLLLVLPVAVLVIGSWHRHALFDDAYINLRVVDQIRHGHGPVFNAGQRVEAVTSSLWLWVLVGLELVLPLRSEWVAVLGGIAFGALGIAFLMAGSARLTTPGGGSTASLAAGGRSGVGSGEATVDDSGVDEAAAGEVDDGESGAREVGPGRRRPLLLPMGALVLVSLTPMWTYTASGLENGLATAWIGASLWVLGRWASRGGRLGLGGAVLVGLGTMVRPELALLTATILVVVVRLDGTSWWRRVALVVAAAAIPGAYQVFRMGYYGVLIPNSAIAKSAGRSRWAEGWAYLAHTVTPYLLWLPLAVLAATVAWAAASAAGIDWRHDRRVWVCGAFVVGGALDVLYVVRVGGDYMHARLLLPGLTAIVGPVAVLPATRRLRWSLVVVPWALLATFVWRSPRDHYGFFLARNHHPVTLADFYWQGSGSGHPGPLAAPFARPGVYYLDHWLGPAPPGGPSRIVAMYGVGVGSYALGPDTEVVDMLGLGDAFTAHLALHRRGLNSHEKPLPAPWVVARLVPPGAPYDQALWVRGPAQTEFHVTLGARQLGNPREPFADRVAAARKALGCPQVVGLSAATTDRLTVHRFLSNVLHSPGRTTFTIEPEPSDELARCGLAPHGG